MKIERPGAVALDANGACAQMGQLIVRCRDDASLFGWAASAVGDSASRKRLLEQARGRRRFADALGAEITALGGRPSAHGSVLASVETALGMLRRAVDGAHEGDAYLACLRTAQRTEKAYARTTRRTLPQPAQGLVEAQSREIDESCRELSILRNRH